MPVHQGDGEESDLLRQMLVWNAERGRLRYGDLLNSDNTDRSRYLQCDGETPCGRCVSQNVTECSYDVPVRQSKEEMRSEIQRLREDQKRTKRILDALSSDNSVDILDRLRNGESLESISRTMENFASPQPQITQYMMVYRTWRARHHASRFLLLHVIYPQSSATGTNRHQLRAVSSQL